ncbi:MAG: glycerophosphodiester phosphodiesterase [Thermoplasmatota archaeon]
MVMRIGHRGAAGYEPENTLRSFERAVEMDVDMIELDVQICATGEIVVIHDRSVDRVTEGEGRVKDLSLQEIRDLDAGKGERIPLLSEVLDLVSGRAGLNIELKSKGTPEPVNDLLHRNIGRKGWRKEQFLVSSFHPGVLLDFSRICGGIRTAVLIENMPYGAEEFGSMIGSYSVNPNHRYLREDFVGSTHDLGMKVIPWTVDDPDDIRRMIDLGADGIISNYPDRVPKDPGN